MPVAPNVPEALKHALENMEATVQSFKDKLPYTSPEMMDERYIELQNSLAYTIIGLHTTLTKE